MKTIIRIIALIALSNVYAYAQHIPPAHSHTSSTVCWGYASARAYGKSWNDPTCPASTIQRNVVDYPNQQTYFTYHSYSGVQVGDIVEFGTTHVGYVSSTWGGVQLDFVENESSTTEKTYIPIQLVIGGNCPSGCSNNDPNYPTIYARGNPTGIWRVRTTGWPIKVQNSFDGGADHGGTVKVAGSVYSSPYTTATAWNVGVSLDAVMDQQQYNGYVRLFRRWVDQNFNTIATSKITSITRSDPYINTEYSFGAEFFRQFNITFNNSFPGVGNGGQLKVNGTYYSLPAADFHVAEDNSAITAQAFWHTYNGIQYTFTNWQDGNTASTRTFYPTDHTTYAANYTGKPAPVTITSTYGPVGTPITIQWQEHVNPNVSQYWVYRKVKHSLTGTWTGPQLLQTLSRGTTTYVDYDYIYTDGYTNDLVFYDIRPYYVTESVFADQHWVSVFGYGGIVPKYTDGSFAETAEPATYSLSNSPNPFNPETRLELRLPNDGEAELRIFNSSGQQVAKLFNGFVRSGVYTSTWLGRDDQNRELASGVYFAQLVVRPADGSETKVLNHRLLLLR